MPQLRRHLRGVPVDRLVFEITEHAEVADYERLNRELKPLRRRGLRLAVDDAGAGFARLRHILRIHPDIIKLDRSLVRGIDRDPVLRALSYSISAFGSAVGASVVAEGIQTHGELNALRFLGVDLGQGYLLQKPAPLSALGLDPPAVRRPTIA
jgi:EAL domain-containing protein (putative c-di-GMP-specific phosphodiesterase class I)